ncbi:MAG: gliding motility-associated C-terminal domain-containing protein [Flavobacteriales bacterium]
MRSRSLLAAPALLFGATVIAQCSLSTNASQTTITCGSCVTLTAFGSGGLQAFSEDFNSGAPTGWQFTQSAQFNNPCSPNGVDGTTHLWMGDGSINPRDMVTVPLDLTLGGSICFDMLFAEQGENSPCEGPDEPQEGVYLEYSVDNGATWITINYFDPNGGYDPQLTNWNNYCFPLPAGALTPNTMIRWHQDDVTDDIYDHWGIDNVVITLNDPAFNITWLHDNFSYGFGSPGGENPTPVCPQTTTTYVAQVSDGVTTCLDSVTVTVVPPVIVMTAGNDTTICNGECVTLGADAYHLVHPESNPTFENNEFALVIGGNSSIDINVQGLFSSTISDGSITSVCINGFNFSGSFICTSFGGCDCNGTPIGFFESCDVTSAGFTVTLTTPGGCDIILAPASGAPGDFSNTCFVPVGGAPIGGSYPAGGTWSPAEPFSDLNDCDINGVWTLSFSAPGVGLGFGSLTGWNISFHDPEVTEPVNFVWSPTTNMTGSNTLSPTVCPTGTTTYTLTATDLAGCTSASDEVTITTENCCSLEVIDVAVVAPGCNVNDGSITITTIQGETTGVTYALNGGTPQTSPTFTGLGPGQYTVTVNDDNDCPVPQSVDLPEAPGPVIDALGQTPSGCDPPSGTITVSATGSGLQYSIDGGVTFQASPVFNGLAAGTYTITVQDGGGCNTTATVDVLQIGGPTIDDVSSTPSACAPPDGTVTVTASGTGLTYSLDGAVFQPSNIFNGIAGGTYTVTVNDDAGCSTTTQVTVAAPQPPVPVITGPMVGCVGETLVLTTTAPFSSYVWSTGENGPSASIGSSGAITVTVTDVDGCIGTSAPFQVQFEGPTAAFTSTPPSPQLPGVTVDFLDASSGNGSTIVGWAWEFGDGNGANLPDVSWTYTEPGQYPVTLTVTTANGCIDSVTVFYIVRPADIIIPNVFSPNNDGQNDAFTIDNIDFFPNVLTIFNRWGSVVYEKKDYRNQWKGTDLPDGTYFYVLVLDDGREFTGHVTLLR